MIPIYIKTKLKCDKKALIIFKLFSPTKSDDIWRLTVFTGSNISHNWTC
jgi:hypothetical protein